MSQLVGEPINELISSSVTQFANQAISQLAS